MGTESQANRPKTVEPERIATGFKSFALEASSRLLDMSFDNADQGLNELTADVGYDPEIFKACDEASRLARDERAKLTMVFIQVLGEGLTGHGIDGGPGDEVLLATDEAEEVLYAGKMAGRLVEGCADELESLEGRLATLADYADVSPTAISPNSLCQAFRQAMQTISGSAEARRMLYALFELTLESRLGGLYQRLDKQLEERGVAPKPRDQASELTQDRPPQSAHWARQLLAARRAVEPENEFGTGEILRGLDSLRDREEVWQSPNALIEKLLAHLRRRQRDTMPRAMPQQSRRQIGLTMAWLCDMQADPLVPARAKPMLEQLRMVLLHIALLDRGLFRDPDNPARRMVNELIALPESTDEEIWYRVGTMVERVVRDFDERPAVVTAAAKALARRRDASGAAALARARRMAELELRQQSLGRIPPPSIQGFLLKGWAPLLVRSYMEGGVTTPTWHTAVIRLSQLLDLCQPALYGSGRESRVRDQRGLVRKIRAQLLDRRVNRGRIAEFIDAIEETFAEANQSDLGIAPEIQDFDELEIWDADVTVIQDEAEEPVEEIAEDDTDGEETMSLQAVDTVVQEACKTGRWFQLHAGGEGGSRWLRVGNYDSERGVVSFINRGGAIVYERPAGEFAEDLRTGRSRPIYDAEAFEAKLASIIGEHVRTLDND